MDWNNLKREELELCMYQFIVNNPYIPITPTNKQFEFLSCFGKDGLYGGAAGGGKSAALLACALMFVGYPNYNALLLRRTYADLKMPEALIDISLKWLSETNAKWNAISNTWTFPSGAKLTFGYLDNENDKYRYQGAAFQFIGFDELTQFSETQFLYLFSRLRKGVTSGIPLRLRASSNPGGIGHEWVKARYLTEGKKGRLFIPAKLYDNPHLDQKSYLESLAELDPVTRMQLESGNWDVVGSGGYFKRENLIIVDKPPISKKGKCVRYWDLAASAPKKGKDPDYTVGVKMYAENGQYWILDVVRGRWTPKELEDVIRQTGVQDGNNTIIYIEQEPGSSGIITRDHFARNVLRGLPFFGDRVQGTKVTRAKPFSSAAANNNVFVIRAFWNNDFVNECIVFPQEGFHDDQVDAASGAFSKLNGGYTPTRKKRAPLKRASKLLDSF